MTRIWEKSVFDLIYRLATSSPTTKLEQAAFKSKAPTFHYFQIGLQPSADIFLQQLIKVGIIQDLSWSI